ncbi:putative ribonuclease H-like domain-containing protein [Tanacetum coccineum]|uniref:Ribonuclease H-like domain-containing protein n=1 Tax=Tanacetum coccineum TaxID=301880 RepID=A0ABQ4YI98_9ASTR
MLKRDKLPSSIGLDLRAQLDGELVPAQVVTATKLPVLNPNEFELWKMRIEQYFVMTDYALWEVILNGDSPLPTRIVDGVETAVPPTTADQKLARKNELKARGTLLMALPNEQQLKFNSYKSSKSLIEAIEKRFRETLSIDDLYNNLKIYEAEVIGSSSTSQNTQNIAFVSSNRTGSTNEAVKTAHGVSAANFKTNASTLLNVDSLSDAMIYYFFAKEIDLKWQMAMLTMRARIFLKKTGRNLGVNKTDTIGFDKTNVECYNCHRRSHFARECRGPKQQDNRNREITRRTVPIKETTSNALVSQCSSSSSNSDIESQLNVGAYKAGLESVEARLDVYKKNEAVFEEDIKILKLNILLRDNALTKLRKKFEKTEKERDDLKLTLEKFENSSKNLRKLLDIQVSDKFKTGVGNGIDQDEEISWFQEDVENQGRYGHDFEVNTASTSITTASINITTAELVTTASAPVTTADVSVSTAEPKKSKEKGVSSETTIKPTRGVIMKEASETITRPIVPPQQQLDPKDIEKGIMHEPKKPVKVKAKDQITFDEEVARRLEA